MVSKLALHGGSSTRTVSWPGWPTSSPQTVNNLLAVLGSERWSISGPYRGMPSFEQRFAEAYACYTGAHYCVPSSCGTASLTMALEAVGVGAGDEVIVPGLSWVASASAVLGVNAVPVLTDVDPLTGCLDASAVERAITPRCRAITVVHLGSAVADLHALRRIAEQNNLPLIEDCAQAHGARFAGQHVGTFGSAGTFSMQHSKLLTSGEGGAVITHDEQLASRLAHLRADGRTLSSVPPPLDHMELLETAELMGSNYCMSEFHAAILLAQLEKMDAENAIRRRNAECLDTLIRQIGCEPQQTTPGTTERVYYNYAIGLPEAVLAKTSVEKLAEALSAELCLPCKPMYSSLNQCNLYQPASRRRFALGEAFQASVQPQRFSLPMAEAFARSHITLPHRFLPS
ncbi:DegT/DnrJ/EryC1/StrS family aminotransferase [Photorhabdus heterorhabditis]|uniref:DegT/DnrJ/EryC1/StrS aminotransferase family protein n=1 Tax=Photorhabdus heterorhabditis TaxID=880156 RepID=UPI0015628280|nr:DegT/DnrJ/EryC1/StrS family aminotransferase [Photorhabdus heterorhabditis]NRN29673.1 DegT/DnrJ/EryC1/StrS family aminotransferase [Photorhabdus heterorhabditis subsp. aluminescens]